VLRWKLFAMAIFCASVFVLAGCGENKSNAQLGTIYETSYGAEMLAFLTEETDSSRAATAAMESKLLVTTESAADAPERSAPETTAAQVTEAAPVTGDAISTLPAGTIVDGFLNDEETVNGCFYAVEISDEIFARMEGKSYKEACTLPLTELRYVRVLYNGFDDCVHIGELVVNQIIAEDCIEIFRGLYDAGYKIGKMVLVDDYGADDNLSMADNNTSSFNYRSVAGTDTLSLHSQGMAIDINPLYNPWIYTLEGVEVIDPPASAAYADRTLDEPYFIDHEDLCFQLFTEHGFEWGGDWSTSKDYQHFSKKS